MFKDKNTQYRIEKILPKAFFSVVVGFIFSFGKSLDKTDNINLKNGSMWIMFAIIFSIVLFISSIISLVFQKNKFRFKETESRRERRKKMKGRKIFQEKSNKISLS